MEPIKRIFLYFFSLLICSSANAQIDSVLLNETAAHLFPSFPFKSSFTSIIDRNNSGYLFSANMESGMEIFDLSVSGQITSILTMDISNFDSLDVSTMKQRDNSLFLGIGDFQTNTNVASGLAILDINNPSSPTIKDIWDTTAFVHGISHILIMDDHAYLSTMSDGIIILDISDESNIKFKSHLELDLNFPAPSSNAHNARGLKFRNDSLFVTFDRGGLRVVDVTDKSNPIEVYKYINTSLNSSAAAAYNDIIIKDNFAFISVDYCGLEVINIGSIPFTNVQWYNPWGCNLTNWSGAPNHFNELKTGSNDSLLFISTGQSEVLAFDITNPTNTILKGSYGSLTDSLATYGVDVFNNQIALSYVRTPFHVPPFTPFFSNPGGLKLLDYSVINNSSGIFGNSYSYDVIKIFPNPGRERISIEADDEIEELSIFDSFSRIVYQNNYINSTKTDINMNDVSKGLYIVVTGTKRGILRNKLVIN